MKNLYGTVNVNKIIEPCDEKIYESINYYKLKDKKYGFEIEKKNGNKEVERMNIIDLTDDEEKINYILKLFVHKQILPSSEDIIEDLVKQYC